MKDRDFEIVKDEERAAPREGSALWIAEVQAGKTVFLPGWNGWQAITAARYRLNATHQRLRTHQVVREGVSGVVVWAEQI